MELLPIGSKGRTEVLRDAANQGIEVINHLKVEIVFSNGNGPDVILELLQGFGSDAPGTAGQDKPQEGITFSIGSDRCLLGTQGESQLRQESLDLGPSLFGLGAVLTKHDEVVGVAHEAQAELIEMPVEPVEDDVCQQGGRLLRLVACPWWSPRADRLQALRSGESVRGGRALYHLPHDLERLEG